MTTKLTAAEQYQRLKNDQFQAFLDNSFSDASLKGVDLYEVKCPSGQVFKCRKLDAAYAAQTGSMPMSLAEAMISAPSLESLSDEEKTKAQEEAFFEQSVAERRANITETIKLIAYICVEPRIVENVGNRTDAIAANDLAVNDVKHLAEWAKTGGGEAPGLKTFRSKRK